MFSPRDDAPLPVCNNLTQRGKERKEVFICLERVLPLATVAQIPATGDGAAQVFSYRVAYEALFTQHATRITYHLFCQGDGHGRIPARESSCSG